MLIQAELLWVINQVNIIERTAKFARRVQTQTIKKFHLSYLHFDKIVSEDGSF
jgi:hypothetical protein